MTRNRDYFTRPMQNNSRDAYDYGHMRLHRDRPVYRFSEHIFAIAIASLALYSAVAVVVLSVLLLWWYPAMFGALIIVAVIGSVWAYSDERRNERDYNERIK